MTYYEWLWVCLGTWIEMDINNYMMFQMDVEVHRKTEINGPQNEMSPIYLYVFIRSTVELLFFIFFL